MSVFGENVKIANDHATKFGAKLTSGLCHVMSDALNKSNEYSEFIDKRNQNHSAKKIFDYKVDRMCSHVENPDGLDLWFVGHEFKDLVTYRNSRSHEGVSSDTLSVKEHVLNCVNTLGRGLVKGAVGVKHDVEKVTQSETFQNVKNGIVNSYQGIREATKEGIKNWRTKVDEKIADQQKTNDGKASVFTRFNKFMNTFVSKANDAYGYGEKAVTGVAKGVSETMHNYTEQVAKSSGYQKLLAAKERMDYDVNKELQDRTYAEENARNISIG